MSSTTSTAHPDVSVVLVVEDENIIDFASIEAEILGQEDVHAELIVVDNTINGTVNTGKISCVRVEQPSRGACYLAALAVARAPLIAFSDVRCRRNPEQMTKLKAVLDAIDAVEMVVSNYGIAAKNEQPEGEVNFKNCRENPLPGWMGGAMVRRTALEAISTKAFWPAELELLQNLLRKQQVMHINEMLYTIDGALLEAGFVDSARDSATVQASLETWEDDAVLTVNLPTHNQCGSLRQTLNGLGRQNVPHGTFAVTIINNGSSDATAAWLESIENWPFPVSIVSMEHGSRGAARNAGLQHTQTTLTLLLTDDVIPTGDLVVQHVLAHQNQTGLAVTGRIQHSDDVCSNNLVQALQADASVDDSSVILEPWMFTTRNTSVEVTMLQAAGGFDESLQSTELCDMSMGVKLGHLGLKVQQVQQAKTNTTQNMMTVEGIKEQTMRLAKSHILLWDQHPDLIGNTQVSVQMVQPIDPSLEQAAAALAMQDSKTLQAAGLEAYALQGNQHLSALMSVLQDMWYQHGLADGLRALDLNSTAELLARHPFDIPDAQHTVWVMIPTMDADQMWVQRVLQFRESFSASDPVTLVLLGGIDGGYSAPHLAEGLQSFTAEQTPHIAIIEMGLPEQHAIRLFAAADGWVPINAANEGRFAQMAELVGCPVVEPAENKAPWPLATNAKLRLLAWPSWSNDDLRSLLENYASVLSDRSDVTLCLRMDPQQVADMPNAMARLQQLAEEVLADGGQNLDVLIVEDPIPTSDLPRLGQAVDGLLALPSNENPDGLGQTLGIPVIHDVAELTERLPS